MKLCAIAAMSENRVIGKNNQLLWRIPEDLKHFKAVTSGCTVVMGRKTFESLGKALPNRRNIVITRQKDFLAENIEVYHSLEKVLLRLETDLEENEQAFIIGGGEIYRQALSYIKKFYLTIVHTSFEGDTTFPEVDLKDDFMITDQRNSSQEKPEKLSFSFITAVRIR